MTDDYTVQSKTIQIDEELTLPNGSEIIDHYRAGGQHVLLYLTPRCGVNGCSRSVSDVAEACHQHTDE